MSTACRCCLLPGDVFANRAPDPVLQQVENFGDGTVTANDCFRPVSRYFDRITRPEQIIPALNRAMQVLTDPAECGPVTLSLCQDVQAEAYDYPESFFAERVWTPRRPQPGSRRARRGGRRAQGGEEAADHRRRRRALFRGVGDAAGLRRETRHSGDGDAGRQVEPAARPSAQHGLRSASPARRPPTCWPSRPTSCWRSAPGCRISPPAPGRCSRRTASRSSG